MVYVLFRCHSFSPACNHIVDCCDARHARHCSFLLFSLQLSSWDAFLPSHPPLLLPILPQPWSLFPALQIRLVLSSFFIVAAGLRKTSWPPGPQALSQYRVTYSLKKEYEQPPAPSLEAQWSTFFVCTPYSVGQMQALAKPLFAASRGSLSDIPSCFFSWPAHNVEKKYP
jgi:hypothetical protein